MTDHSRARLFFDETIGKKEKSFEFLVALLNAGESAAENGWRDYKEAGFIGRTGNSDEDKEKIKKQWSENLSSFANTGGGVLIWGFHTKGKIPDKLSLAPDCQQLAELLRSLTNDATDPYVAGIEIEAIKDPTKPQQGIVICYIPASTFAPHQAQWGERTYFIRTQDSNLPCPQPLLRNMFYPRALSRLQPIVKMTAHAQQGGSISVKLEVRIGCLGPATAEVAMITIEERELSGPIILRGDQWEEIGGNILRLRHPLPPNLFAPSKIGIEGILLSNGASVMFRFFAHNTPVHYSTVSFTQEEVRECLRSKAPLERRGQSDPMPV